ncbi:hypothetical protein SDC9_121271 [bioreactor metagenome]|uniref:Uncharacterized protein n=1 Tax=bioreactor metagenome TaxID=1076179 RepID=A0A645CBI4_9ZZZZ
MHAFNVRNIFDRFQRHNHLDSSAIGIGNDISRACQRIFGIHFGHHQRNIVVHPESA